MADILLQDDEERRKALEKAREAADRQAEPQTSAGEASEAVLAPQASPPEKSGQAAPAPERQGRTDAQDQAAPGKTEEPAPAPEPAALAAAAQSEAARTASPEALAPAPVSAPVSGAVSGRPADPVVDNAYLMKISGREWAQRDQQTVGLGIKAPPLDPFAEGALALQQMVPGSARPNARDAGSRGGKPEGASGKALDKADAFLDDVSQGKTWGDSLSEYLRLEHNDGLASNIFKFQGKMFVAGMRGGGAGMRAFFTNLNDIAKIITKGSDDAEETVKVFGMLVKATDYWVEQMDKIYDLRENQRSQGDTILSYEKFLFGVFSDAVGGLGGGTAAFMTDLAGGAAVKGYAQGGWAGALEQQAQTAAIGLVMKAAGNLKFLGRASTLMTLNMGDAYVHGERRTPNLAAEAIKGAVFAGLGGRRIGEAVPEKVFASENVREMRQAVQRGQATPGMEQVAGYFARVFPERDQALNLRVVGELVEASSQAMEQAGRPGQWGIVLGKATTGMEGESLKAAIDLYLGADISTVVHEHGHLYFDHLSASERAPLEKWYRAETQGQENPPVFKEWVTEQFTTYCLNKRPWERSPSMADGFGGVFWRLADRMGRLVQSVRNIEGNKTPEDVTRMFEAAATGKEGDVFSRNAAENARRQEQGQSVAEQGRDQVPGEPGAGGGGRQNGQVVEFGPDAKTLEAASWIESKQVRPATIEENIQAGRDAIALALKTNQNVLNAMYLEGVGDVAFYWGTPGVGEKFKRGEGLAHIDAKHGRETLDMMPEVIARGRVVDHQREGVEGERIHINYNGYTAILSLWKYGGKETWLLTGWKDYASDAQGGGQGDGNARPMQKGSSGATGGSYIPVSATHAGPTMRRPGVGAEDPNYNIPSFDPSVNGAARVPAPLRHGQAQDSPPGTGSLASSGEKKDPSSPTVNVSPAEALYGKVQEGRQETQGGGASVRSRQARTLEQAFDDLFIGKIPSRERGEKQTVTLLGGMSGSGKTSSTATPFWDEVIRRSVLVDPDALKLATGRLGEADHKAHVQASEKALSRAMEEGYDLLYDSTMSNFPKALGIVEKTLAKDGRVNIVFVDTAPENAIPRIVAREAQTGRAVPADAVARTHNMGLPTFLELFRRFQGDPRVNFELHDNNDNKPQLLFRQENGEIQIFDQAAVDRILATPYKEPKGGRYERAQDTAWTPDQADRSLQEARDRRKRQDDAGRPGIGGQDSQGRGAATPGVPGKTPLDTSSYDAAPWPQVGDAEAPWSMEPGPQKQGAANAAPVVAVNFSHVGSGSALDQTFAQIGAASKNADQSPAAQDAIQGGTDQDGAGQSPGSPLAADPAGRASRARDLRGPDSILAASLGVTPDTLARRRSLQPLSPEQALGAQAVVASSAQALTDLAGRIQEGHNSDAMLAALAGKMTAHAAVAAQAMGDGPRAAQALRALAAFAPRDRQSVRAAVEQAGGRAGIERAAQTFSVLAAVGAASPAQITAAAIESAQPDWRACGWESGPCCVSLLAASPEPARNAVANAVTACMADPARAVAAQWGLDAPATTGGAALDARTGEARAKLWGFLQAQADTLKIAAAAFAAGGDPENNTPLPPSLSPLARCATPPLERMADVLWEALPPGSPVAASQEDYAATLNYRADLGAQAYRAAAMEGLEGQALTARARELMNAPTPAMRRQAMDAGRNRAFDIDLDRAAMAAAGSANPGAAKILAPFTRAPGAVLRHAQDDTVLAPLFAGLARDIQAGGPRAGLAQAQMTMGASLMSLGASLAHAGALTGQGPADPDERQAWLRLAQPHSIRIDGQWHSYAQAPEALATFLALSADYHDAATHWQRSWDGFGPTNVWELAAAAAHIVGKNATGRQFLQDASRLLGSVDAPENFDPAVLYADAPLDRAAHINRWDAAADPATRLLGQTLDSLLQRGPDAAASQAVRRNLWGEPIFSVQTGPAVAWWPPAPTGQTPPQPTPADAELLRCGPDMPMPPRAQSLRGVNVNLTAQEYSRLLELAGQKATIRFQGDPVTLKEHVNRLVASPAYRNAAANTSGPGGPAALALRDVIQSYQGVGCEMLLDETPRLQHLVRQGLERKMTRAA